jgi:hypothetical protein
MASHSAVDGAGDDGTLSAHPKSALTAAFRSSPSRADEISESVEIDHMRDSERIRMGRNASSQHGSDVLEQVSDEAEVSSAPKPGCRCPSAGRVYVILHCPGSPFCEGTTTIELLQHPHMVPFVSYTNLGVQTTDFIVNFMLSIPRGRTCLLLPPRLCPYSRIGCHGSRLTVLH